MPRFDVDRIGRGHVHIPNLCASLFGGIQPDKLAGYLRMTTRSLDNDGLFQRFQLLVFPDPQVWEWRNDAPDRYARDRAYETFDQLASFNPVRHGAIAKGEYDSMPKITELTQTAIGKTVIWPSQEGVYKLDSAQLNQALQFGLK